MAENLDEAARIISLIRDLANKPYDTPAGMEFFAQTTQEYIDQLVDNLDASHLIIGTALRAVMNPGTAQSPSEAYLLALQTLVEILLKYGVPYPVIQQRITAAPVSRTNPENVN